MAASSRRQPPFEVVAAYCREMGLISFAFMSLWYCSNFQSSEIVYLDLAAWPRRRARVLFSISATTRASSWACSIISLRLALLR